MNPIERKEMEYRAKVRALGARVRALDLDSDETGQSTERDAAAEDLVRENPPKLVEDALWFAGYLRGLADPKCGSCGGVGAIRFKSCRCDGAEGPDGDFSHSTSCKGGIATEGFNPCECAARGEREARNRAQETAPAFRSTRGGGVDLDRRVAEAESQLAAAERRRDAATAPIRERIAARAQEVASYEGVRAGILRLLAVGEEEVGRHQIVLDRLRVVESEGLTQDEAREVAGAQDPVSSWMREVARLRRELASAKSRLEAERGKRDAEIRKEIAEVEREIEAVTAANRGHLSSLADHEVRNADLVREVASLAADRDRIARHYESKVARARARLRRLRYLRGDGPDVTVDEVKVQFSPAGVS